MAAMGSSPKCKLLPDYKASHPRRHNSLVTTATSKSSTMHSVQSTRQQRSETPNPKFMTPLSEPLRTHWYEVNFGTWLQFVCL